MVVDPADYTWSSYRCFALDQPDPLLTPHAAILRLGPNAAGRQQAYRDLVAQAIDPAETDAIRRHVQHQQAYGPDRFRRMIEQQLGRSIGPKKVGRPSKRPPEAPPQQEIRL
jgi:putative transposase